MFLYDQCREVPFERNVAMIQLMFVVCLNATPQICEKQTRLYTDQSVSTCYRQAQHEMARWVGRHGQWHIQRWGCNEVIPNAAEI